MTLALSLEPRTGAAANVSKVRTATAGWCFQAAAGDLTWFQQFVAWNSPIWYFKILSLSDIKHILFPWQVQSKTMFPKIVAGYCKNIYLFIYSMEQSPSWEATKIFPAFNGTRRFITAFKSAHQLPLSWASSIHSIPPHPTSWKSNLTFSSHLRLGLPSGVFPSGFPTKTLYTPHLSPIRATFPAHSIILYFITRTIMGEEFRSLRIVRILRN